MGAYKNNYITITNIKPNDVIEGLRKKIKELEKEIKELKDANMQNL